MSRGAINVKSWWRWLNPPTPGPKPGGPHVEGRGRGLRRDKKVLQHAAVFDGLAGPTLVPKFPTLNSVMKRTCGTPSSLAYGMR